MFIRVALAAGLALHLLIAWRLSRPAPSRAARALVWTVSSLLFALLALVPATWANLVELGLDEAERVWLLWPSYIAMGLYSLVFTLWAVREVAWLGARALHALGHALGSEPLKVLPADPSRRTALAHALNLSVLGASGALAGVGAYEARKRAAIRPVKVPIAGLPAKLEGFRILQISDVHVGPTIGRDYFEAIVDAINAEAPDLVVITGDLVDGSVPFLEEAVSPITRLRARHGVAFCTGNHEYYSGVEPWVEHLRQSGLRVLLNEHTVIEHEGRRLLLGGCTDEFGRVAGAAHRQDIAACNDPSADVDVRILLSHRPGTIFEAAKQGFDLQLSGHTHGGQFVPWNLVVKLVHPFSAGLDRFGDTWIYVNRGTGYFGPPVRLAVPSEITRLELTAA